MEITDIQVRLRDEDKLKGFVNLTFDNCFVVRGCKIIQGSSGYFVSMPSQKQEDGSYRDIAHPINSEMRQIIENQILKAYVSELRTRTAIQSSPPTELSRHPHQAPERQEPMPVNRVRPFGDNR